MYVFFLGLIPQRIHTSQHRTALPLCYCFRLKSGKGSKAAKRLGDFLQTE